MKAELETYKLVTTYLIFCRGSDIVENRVRSCVKEINAYLKRKFDIFSQTPKTGGVKGTEIIRICEKASDEA